MTKYSHSRGRKGQDPQHVKTQVLHKTVLTVREEREEITFANPGSLVVQKEKMRQLLTAGS